MLGGRKGLGGGRLFLSLRAKIKVCVSSKMKVNFHFTRKLDFSNSLWEFIISSQFNQHKINPKGVSFMLAAEVQVFSNFRHIQIIPRFRWLWKG